METDGLDTNREGISGVSNVVPFPRDWIGSLDDLVPLNSAPSDDAAGEEGEQALGAQTFWSEGSASLHQVIEAPSSWSVPSGSSEHACAPEVSAAAQRGPSRHRGPRWYVVRRSRSSTARRLRAAAVGAAVACLAAGAASALEGSAPAPVTTRSTVMAGATELGGLSAGTSNGSSEALRLSRLLVERAIQRTSRGFRGTHRAVPHRRDAPRRRPSPSSAGSASQVNVSYNLPQGGSSAPATGTAAPQVPSSTTAPAVQSSPTTFSSGASDTSGSSSTSGPSGPGAPFGPGQMTGG